jgi:hypothetical protein
MPNPTKYRPKFDVLLKSLASDEELSKKLHVTRQTICNWRKRVPPVGTKAHSGCKKRFLDYEPIDKMIKAGIPPIEIAKKVGCKPATIQSRKRLLGLSCRINQVEINDRTPLISPQDRLQAALERKRECMGLTPEQMIMWLSGQAGSQFLSDGGYR